MPEYIVSPLLHIYGQHQWHDDAFIIGDRKGLEILRDAIDKALQTDGPVTTEKDVFVNDGEGYTVAVLCTESHGVEPDKLAVPYSLDFAKETNDDAVWPETLVHREHTIVEELADGTQRVTGLRDMPAIWPPEQPDPVCSCGKTSSGLCPRCGQDMG